MCTGICLCGLQQHKFHTAAGRTHCRRTHCCRCGSQADLCTHHQLALRAATIKIPGGQQRCKLVVSGVASYLPSRHLSAQQVQQCLGAASLLLLLLLLLELCCCLLSPDSQAAAQLLPAAAAQQAQVAEHIHCTTHNVAEPAGSKPPNMACSHVLRYVPPTFPARIGCGPLCWGIEVAMAPAAKVC